MMTNYTRDLQHSLQKSSSCWKSNRPWSFYNIQYGSVCVCLCVCVCVCMFNPTYTFQESSSNFFKHHFISFTTITTILKHHHHVEELICPWSFYNIWVCMYVCVWMFKPTYTFQESSRVFFKHPHHVWSRFTRCRSASASAFLASCLLG